MKNTFKFWIIFSLVVAFGAGILGGIFSERYFFHRQRHARIERNAVHFPSLEQMARELGLSAEQQEQIRNIFQRNEAKFKDLRSEIHGRLSTIREEVKSEIESVLTQEQKQKFEEMIENYVLQRKREFEKRGKDFRKEQPREKSRGEMK